MNIHATCIKVLDKGVLFLGDSGAGKSDLALRMITSFGASLIADDRTELNFSGDSIIASAPANLKGLLEVRGVGIVKFPSADSASVCLAVKLTTEPLERLPEKSFYQIDSISLPQIKLNPFEASAPAKILAALSLL